MSSTARKAHLVQRASPMSETASMVADAGHDIADALRTLAGVLAWIGAAEHSDTHGRQKEMAAVILKFAVEGFFSTKIDGTKVSQADQEQAERMFHKLFPLAKGKR